MENERSDLAGTRRRTIVIWGLPGAVMAVSASLSLWVQFIWPVAQLWMGGACALNARRCGRTHCYFTSVFFTIMALVSILQGFEILPAGGSAWAWNGGVTAAGGALLTWLPERLLGRFMRPRNHRS